MKKWAIMTLIACMTSGTAFAQWSWFAKAGVDMTTLSGYQTKYTLKSGVGYHFGVGAVYDLGSSFSLQSTLTFLTRAFRTEGTATNTFPETEIYTYKTDYDATYLELPVVISYAIPVSKDVAFHVSTGPSFGYGLGGSYESVFIASDGDISETEGDYFGASSASTVTDSRFDLGWNLGLMLDYKRFLVGIDATWGILGHAMYGDSDNKSYNTRYSLSVGYRF